MPRKQNPSHVLELNMQFKDESLLADIKKLETKV